MLEVGQGKRPLASYFHASRRVRECLFEPRPFGVCSDSVNVCVNRFESQAECGGTSSRAIRWGDDFRMSTLTDVYRSKLNDNTCNGANDGVCSDGGEGDFERFAHGGFYARSMNITHVTVNGVVYDDFTLSNIQNPSKHVSSPRVGQFVYMHTVTDNDGTMECFNTGSACTRLDSSLSVPKRTSGRLQVHSVNYPSTSTSSVPDVIVLRSISASSCDTTATTQCPNLASDTTIKACYHEVNEDPVNDEPCSYNVWSVGFTEGDPFCSYGSDRNDCGDRSDIVSWGISAADFCFNEHFQDYNVRYHDNADLRPAAVDIGFLNSGDGNCNDGGGSIFIIGRCPLGTDTADCGERRLSMPVSRAGPSTPGDTCKTARNGRCEDGLYFSMYNANDETFSAENHKDSPFTSQCIPNTE